MEIIDSVSIECNKDCPYLASGNCQYNPTDQDTRIFWHNTIHTKEENFPKIVKRKDVTNFRMKGVRGAACDPGCRLGTSPSSGVSDIAKFGMKGEKGAACDPGEQEKMKCFPFLCAHTCPKKVSFISTCTSPF